MDIATKTARIRAVNHAKPAEITESNPEKPGRISRSMLWAEPFRLFFPAAVCAGLTGVLLWPLHFSGLAAFYPGTSHARLMGHGFFGGFILGFLGTAVPRMLSARPLGPIEAGGLLAVYALMVSLHACGFTAGGDLALLTLLAFLATSLLRRFATRTDLPPPGFVLLPIAFAAVITGVLLDRFTPQDGEGLTAFRLGMPRLLMYQGFVLLPIMAVGPFLFPRFFGKKSSHDLPEAASPTREWTTQALIAATAGSLVVGSFLVEAQGWTRSGHFLRFCVVLGYLLLQSPVFRSGRPKDRFARSLKTGSALLALGFLAVSIAPIYRIALLHLTLVGGAATITISVATRVVFGHSGNHGLLSQRNRWFTVASVLMYVGMLTRVSGDFWPKIMISHYNYGAIFWGGGLLVWAWHVIPKVLVPDPD
jgi:uncharacterized protein involved in response to NO